MITLQIFNQHDIKKITIRELKQNEKPQGQEKYFHPDCVIFLKGRTSDLVSYNLQLALQDRHMSVRALRRLYR